MPGLARNTWVWAAGILLVLAVALLAYSRRNLVPVSTYTGFLSTQSMTPLRTELYDYIRPAHAEVKPEPPLAFVFPAAYYADGLSLKGGPVAIVNLQIDIETWQPFALHKLKSQLALGRGYTAEEQALVARTLDVAVSSNFAMRGGPRSRGSLLALRRMDGFPAKWLGMNVIAYRDTSDGVTPNRPPLIIDNIDVSSASLYAYNKTQPPDDVLIISSPKTYGCSLFFYYYGRGVTVNLYPQYLGKSHEIARAVIKFLDEHRVSTPPVPKFPTQKFFQ